MAVAKRLVAINLYGGKGLGLLNATEVSLERLVAALADTKQLAGPGKVFMKRKRSRKADIFEVSSVNISGRSLKI